MQTMKGSLLLAFAALVISADASAAGYSSAVNISIIETADTTGVARVFLVFDSRPHVTSCSLDNATQAFWRLGGNAENQKNMMAVATAARLAERPVKVLFVDTYSGSTSCDAAGTSGYPVISGLELL